MIWPRTASRSFHRVSTQAGRAMEISFGVRLGRGGVGHPGCSDYSRAVAAGTTRGRPRRRMLRRAMDTPREQLSRTPWQTLSSRPVYENRWIRVREDVARLPDGRTTLYGVV